MCECGASLCDRRVPVHRSDYEGLAGVAPLLAEEHDPWGAGGLGGCRVCGGRRHRRERRR